MDEVLLKRKSALYTTLETVAILIIAIVGNLFDWLHLEFDPSKIKTAEYWSSTAVQVTMYVCSMMVGYLASLQKLELKSEDYHNLLKKYRELLVHKKQSFARFIDEYYNPMIKKKFIKEDLERRLHRLDKRAKDIWKLDYQHRHDEGFQYSSEKSKKYCETRENIELMCTDEYLNENYMSINCRYPRVLASVFTYYLDARISERSQYQVTNNTGADATRRIGQKFLLGFASAALIGTIALGPNVSDLVDTAWGWASILLNYLLRVGMVGFNVFMGARTAKRVFDANFVLPVQNRIRILGEYTVWRVDTGDLDTQADKILEAYENQKTLEEKLNEKVAVLERISSNKKGGGS